MSEASKHTGFTASDMERYHNGTMPAAERHALEKAALDDPFLADALEGYAYTATPGGDLAKIQKRLSERTSQENRTILPLGRFGWLKSAAILLIVGGGGWLVYKTTRSPQREIATTRAPKEYPSNPGSKADTTHARTFTYDSSTATQTTAAAPTAEKEVQEPRPRYSIVKKPKNISHIAANSRAAANKHKGSLDLASTEAPPVKEEISAMDAPPVANQDITKRSLVAAAPDTTTVAVRNQSPADTLHLNIVLKEDKASLSEVVVVNKGLKRKAEIKPPVTIEESEPADGWSSFTDYIAERLKEPELKQKYSGEVELSFDVNRNGEPVNIVVTKSQCDRCDEEAIRLLKEGPKWKKKSSKGKVTIHF